MSPPTGGSRGGLTVKPPSELRSQELKEEEERKEGGRGGRRKEEKGRSVLPSDGVKLLQNKLFFMF